MSVDNVGTETLGQADAEADPGAVRTNPLRNRNATAGSARSRNERMALRTVIVVLVCLIALTLVLIVLETQGSRRETSAAGSSSGMEWIDSIYAFGPGASQQFYRPTDAALARDGSIWVVDGQRARLVHITAQGRLILLRQFERGSGRGQVGNLQSASIDGSGNVYVTDPVRGVIMKLSPKADFITEWKASRPGDLTVVGDELSVTRRAGWSVWALDGRKIVGTGETRGSESASMDLPRGILVDKDGTTYVSDTGNRQVKAYSRSGQLLWASSGATGSAQAASGDAATKAGGFQVPVGLAMDDSHRLVVVDAFDFSLRLLDPATGRRIGRAYGEPGSGEGQFLYPTNLSYDPTRDWFVVADTYNGRIQVLRLPGSGGGLSAAARRAATPWWCCGFPLAGAILAVLLVVAARRQKEAAAEDDDLAGA